MNNENLAGKLFQILSGGSVIDTTLPSNSSSHKRVFHEAQAHTWPIATVLAYLCSIIEMPQYASSFQRAEINGMVFISFYSIEDIVFVVSTLKHELHGLKILSHAKLLRDRWVYTILS